MAAGHVIVVGAGLAGLSAAVALKASGFDVELVERSRLLGGKATSFEVDGVEVDNGQHVYLGCCTEFIEFVKEVMADDTFLSLQPRFEVLLLTRGKKPAVIRAARLPAPLHLAPALLRYRYLSWRDRVRIALALLRAWAPAQQSESFSSWLDRHGQSPMSRIAFWDPFFVPALNASLDKVSAESGLFIIRTAFLSDAGAARFGFARQPLARIAEAAASKLDRVRLRQPVATLVHEPERDGTPWVRGVVLEDGAILRADGVVLALSPDRLMRVLKEPRDFGLDGLDAFRTAPIVDVHLWYDVPSIGFGFAAMVDSPMQWIFEKGPGYVCCSMSAASRYVSVPSAELVELCDRELKAVLPALSSATLLRGAATRDRAATFIPSPGLYRPGPTTTSAQLVIAGAWTDTGWPATMESAVRSGRSAARALSASLAVWGKIPVG